MMDTMGVRRDRQGDGPREREIMLELLLEAVNCQVSGNAGVDRAGARREGR